MNEKKLDNTKLLIAANHSSNKPRLRVINSAIPYEFSASVLNLDGIRKILAFVSAVHNRFPGVPVPLHIDMGGVVASDKLSITLLECIAYSLMVDYHHRISMYFNFEHTIFTECIKYSPLRFLGNPTPTNTQQFFRLFASDLRIDHFRRIISVDAAETGTLSETMTDIQLFLQHQSIDCSFSAQLAEVVAELLGNATEHSKTSCLLDVDFSSSYYKKGTIEDGNQVEQDKKYLGVSISLVSFSRISFEAGVKNKFVGELSHSSRYARVAEALVQHSAYFSERYTIDDFFRIVAFQDRISGRIGDTTSGGTGLTTLVKSLADHSDSDLCYLLTGNRILRFDKQYLDHDADGWIGFNRSNDFFNNPPEQHILRESCIKLPGVAYNLNFVYRKEADV